MTVNYLNRFSGGKPIDLVRQKPVNVHERYYKILKLYCAMNDLSIVDVVDKLVQDGIQNGTIKDVTPKEE